MFVFCRFNWLLLWFLEVERQLLWTCRIWMPMRLTRSIQNTSTFISWGFRQQKLSQGMFAGWRSAIATFKFFKKWFLHRFMYLDLPCLLVPDCWALHHVNRLALSYAVVCEPMCISSICIDLAFYMHSLIYFPASTHPLRTYLSTNVNVMWTCVFPCRKM